MVFEEYAAGLWHKKRIKAIFVSYYDTAVRFCFGKADSILIELITN